MALKPQTLRPRGFSLTELLITIAIVGILAAIAYPSYMTYVRGANRTDATRTMMTDAQTLQRCYSQNFSYVNSGATPCPVVAGTTTSPNGYYSIVITMPAVGIPAPSYSIQATPVAGKSQAADAQCATFTLSSTGQQTSANSGGTDSSSICWGSK